MAENWQALGTSQDDESFTIPEDVRRQHLYVLGRTGTGKSTLLARLALSDIARGDGLLLLDPHGDLALDVLMHCPPSELHRVIYLDPGDREYPVPMNLFECAPDQDKDTVCAEIVGVFKGLYGDSWGPLLEDLLRSLTLAMLDHQYLPEPASGDVPLVSVSKEEVPEEHRYNATLKEAHDFLLSQSMRNEYYEQLFFTNDMVRRFWQDFYDHLGTTAKGQEVNWRQVQHASSTMNKLRRFLLNPLIFDIFCNRNRLNPIDLRQAMQDRKVIIVNLSKGSIGEENSALIGSVLLSRLAVAALSRSNLSRGERQAATFHLIADEFQSFATSSFRVLLSEARKYGVTVTIAHQHREQLDDETRGATLNCGSVMYFRLTGRDGQELAKEFDLTPVSPGMRYEPIMLQQSQIGPNIWQQRRSQANDGEFRQVYERGSFSETERFIANTLTQLPNYSALVKLADGASWRVHSLPLPEPNYDELEQRLEALVSARRALAVQPDQRPSILEASFISAVRTQQAKELDYEASMEDLQATIEVPDEVPEQQLQYQASIEDLQATIQLPEEDEETAQVEKPPATRKPRRRGRRRRAAQPPDNPA